MGTYIPREPTRPKTISEALLEAEDDHFLDCPNADFWIRTGAFLLDAIFFWLLWSGIHHTFSSMGPNLVANLERLTLFSKFLSHQGLFSSKQLLPFFEHVCHGFLIFLYFCATLSSFGGSPGKLLLGLRVVDAQTGSRIGFGRAIYREIFGKMLSTITLGLGWGMVLIRRDTRALHDLTARTTVKRILSVQ